MPSLIQDNIQYLSQFDCGSSSELDAESEKSKIIRALKVIQDAADVHIFGVLSPSFPEAIQALNEYVTAFDYPQPDFPQAIDGPTYLKYNPSTQLCYADTYEGRYQGVLISCQSDASDGLNQMFGHLPLDLFR